MKRTRKKVPESLSANFAALVDMGAGGFGQIKLGFRLKNLDPCAIKIAYKKDPKVREMLENEEKLLQQLRAMDHKCLIKLYDAVRTDDRLYFVMELCDKGKIPDRHQLKQQLMDKRKCLINIGLNRLLSYIYTSYATRWTIFTPKKLSIVI